MDQEPGGIGVTHTEEGGRGCKSANPCPSEAQKVVFERIHTTQSSKHELTLHRSRSYFITTADERSPAQRG